MCNENYGIRGAFPQESKYLQHQSLNKKRDIPRCIGGHSEVHMNDNELMSKCGIIY